MDKIITRIPINETAGKVVSQGGEFNPVIKKLNDGYKLWKNEPDALSHPYTASKDFKNIVGLKKGKLTVIKYYGKQGAQDRARWVVRCQCGNYELRTAKNLKKPDSFDCCLECQTIERLKKKKGTQDMKHIFGKFVIKE